MALYQDRRTEQQPTPQPAGSQATDGSGLNTGTNGSGRDNGTGNSTGISSGPDNGNGIGSGNGKGDGTGSSTSTDQKSHAPALKSTAEHPVASDPVLAITGWRIFSYLAVLLVTTGVLIWTLRLVKMALIKSGPERIESVVRPDGVTVSTKKISAAPLYSVLNEPPAPGTPNPDPSEQKGSFSRTAGAVGAAGMASFTIGFGYWILYALFFGQSLAVLRDVRWYFLSGSALFFPYAFNQLSRLFSPDH
jgi:hypothetical protein